MSKSLMIAAATMPSPVIDVTSRFFRLQLLDNNSGVNAGWLEIVNFKLLGETGHDNLLNIPDTTVTLTDAYAGVGVDWILNESYDQIWSATPANIAETKPAIIFDHNVELTPRRFSLTTARNGTSGSSHPKEFKLQISDDGVEWTTVAHVKDQVVWGTHVTRTFVIPNNPHDEVVVESTTYIGVTARHFRMPISANNGQSTYVEMAEMQFLDHLDNNVTHPTETIVTGHSAGVSGSVLSKLVDGLWGNNSTHKWVGTPVANAWVAFDLGEEKIITAFNIIAGTGSFTAQRYPRDFRMEYSHDGIEWTPIKSFTNQVNWFTSQIRRFPLY